MARYQFGGDLAGWVFSRNDTLMSDLVQLRPGVTVTFWDAPEGGTQHTDLVLGGTPVTSISTSTGTDGRERGSLPIFDGPDGVISMWAEVSGASARYRIHCNNLDEILHDLEQRITEAQTSLRAGAIYVAAADADLGEKSRAHYVCDGLDDQVEIQAAIANAVASGLQVLLSKGHFIIEASIEIDEPVTISGIGRDLTVLEAGASLDDYVIKFVSQSSEGVIGARFADFTIDGHCDTQSAGGGILANGAVQCVFERVRIHNAYDWGLVLGPTFTSAFGHHNRIINCLFDASLLSAGHGGGVHLTSNDENWFYGSDFEFLGGITPPSGLSAPVALYDLAGLQKIINVTFVGGKNNCIQLFSRDTKLTQVIGCTFDGSAGHAVMVSGSQHVIQGNTVTSPGDQGDTPASGIYLEFGATGCIVNGNVIESSPVDGKTYALIRETGDGDAGSNIIVANSLRVVGTVASPAGPMDLSGAGSVVQLNVTLLPSP